VAFYRGTTDPMAMMGKRCENDWCYGYTVDVVIGDEKLDR
jgi:hypothetical protein